MKNVTKFPRIMGILNMTPDSFSDGGLYDNKDAALKRAVKMAENGADIIDVGGESTRPGAKAVNAKEERERVIPVIKALRAELPEISISVDTTKPEVALAAAEAGANILNDISALDFAPELADIAASNNMGLILMHMKGTPRTMQQNPVYKDVVSEVFESLRSKIVMARERGVREIIADVGIGFGKSLEHNLTLLRRHAEFRKLNTPMLLGISRKSFIHKLLDIENPTDRDFPTAIIHALMINSGADIIRVHNVELISMTKVIHKALNN